MSDKIVPMPQRQTFYWQCACGCQVFYCRDDGALECYRCEAEQPQGAAGDNGPVTARQLWPDNDRY
ncbi:MAG: hypothetical protein CMM93_02415 [Rickettsiales bacterium]|nr:hypothetical protein [Rickettsiales bacterium]